MARLMATIDGDNPLVYDDEGNVVDPYFDEEDLSDPLPYEEGSHVLVEGLQSGTA